MGIQVRNRNATKHVFSSNDFEENNNNNHGNKIQIQMD